MNRHRKWTILWIFIPIIIVGVLILLTINYLLDPNIFRNILQKSLTTAFNREVSIGKAKIYWWGGVGIVFEDLRIKDRTLAFDLLQAKKMILRLKLLPLLKREIKWRRIVIDQPAFHLIRDKKGQFNIFFEDPLTDEKIEETQKKILSTLTTFFGGSIAFRDGEIFFSDERLSDSPVKTEIRSFNFDLSKVSNREVFPFQINGKIVHSEKESHFSIIGTVQNIPEDLDLSKGRVDFDFKTKDIDTFHFWPYLKMLLPMKTISGILDLNAHYQGDFKGTFKTTAKIKLKELFLDYPQVFSTVLQPKWVNIDLKAEYDGNDFKIPQLSIELPELWVKAKGRIYNIGSKEMGIEAEASSSPFDVTEGKKFIPFRIITPDVSEPLFRSEGKGLFQIISVKLSGKMPEIDHCDQLANAHVLSIEAKLNGAQLKLPWNVPPLEDLKGQLLFEKGHLYLKNIEGKIFHSTLEKINGTFIELLHVPTLQIDCQGKFDLTDLHPLAKIEAFPDEFSRALSSINILSGEALYSLSVRGVLIPPFQFQHQGTYHLSQVRLNHQQIPFPILIGDGKMQFSHKDLQWSEARVEFGHSSLMINGLWKHGEKDHPLEIRARGRMDLKDLFPLVQSPSFPEEIRSKTEDFETFSGTALFSFKGKNIPGTSRFSYEGEVFPKEASLLLKGKPLPLVFKEGGISFSNLGIVFLKTGIQLGSSFVTLDGHLREGNMNLSTRGSIDLKQLFSYLKTSFLPDQIRSEMEGIEEITGVAEVRLKWFGRTEKWISALQEGEIRLKGIHLQHQEIPVPLSLTEGSFSVTPEQIRLDELKGKVGDSPLAFSGTLSRSSSPSFPSSHSEKSGGGLGAIQSSRTISFQISSPQLDLDPLFPKKEGASSTSFEKVRTWLLKWSLDGMLQINQGKYRGLYYQDLKGEMKTVNGTLFIRPLKFKSEGGDFWGEGWIRPTEKGIRFEIKPRLSNIEAKAFLRTLFQKGEEEILITGNVHIDKAELQGEGEDFLKMRGSLNGRLRFEIENGVIERFNILSKIFSILNVSQFFKGRLPDLKTKGLPYHRILANIDLKDGVASTNDFLVDSDAMRITLFGKVDLGKDMIDVRIGVHPLVTIDAILSSVPIVGYILTGKDKAFISYFYEVKGNLDNPKIEAIPLKSIEEPFWGSIKRLLETPLRPFRKNSSSK
jgi:uncharacterized protein YhdP